jgi:hypothetical protein
MGHSILTRRCLLKAIGELIDVVICTHCS